MRYLSCGMRDGNRPCPSSTLAPRGTMRGSRKTPNPRRHILRLRFGPVRATNFLWIGESSNRAPPRTPGPQEPWSRERCVLSGVQCARSVPWRLIPSRGRPSRDDILRNERGSVCAQRSREWVRGRACPPPGKHQWVRNRLAFRIRWGAPTPYPGRSCACRLHRRMDNPLGEIVRGVRAIFVQQQKAFSPLPESVPVSQKT